MISINPCLESYMCGTVSRLWAKRAGHQSFKETDCLFIQGHRKGCQNRHRCPYWSQTSLSKGQTVYLLVRDKTNQLRERERESTLYLMNRDIYCWGKTEPSMHKNFRCMHNDIFLFFCFFFKWAVSFDTLIIIIIIDNFCIALFSGVPKLTALYNILQHFLSFTNVIHIIMTPNNV